MENKQQKGINNPGSIVLTKEDYKECFEQLNNGVVGSILKIILATNTVLFIGYSMNDFDFTKLYSFIKNELKKYKRQAYIVTLDTTSLDRYKSIGLIPIYTDATYFMKTLKYRLIEKDEMLSNIHIEAGELLFKAVMLAHKLIHKELNYYDNPSLVYAGAYQDGMIHALERSFEIKKTGYYHDRFNLIGIIDTYYQLRKDYIKSKNYLDAAYVYGYMIVLMFYLSLHEDEKEEEEIPPLFFLYGVNELPEKYEEFKRLLKKEDQLHKSSFKLAKRIVKKKIGDDKTKDIDLHHPPYLINPT